MKKERERKGKGEKGRRGAEARERVGEGREGTRLGYLSRGPQVPSYATALHRYFDYMHPFSLLHSYL